MGVRKFQCLGCCGFLESLVVTWCKRCVMERKRMLQRPSRMWEKDMREMVTVLDNSTGAMG